MHVLLVQLYSKISNVSSFLLKIYEIYLYNWFPRHHGNRPRTDTAYLKTGSAGRWRARDKPQRTTVFFRSSRQLLKENVFQ